MMTLSCRANSAVSTGAIRVSSSIMEVQLIRSLQAEPELQKRGCGVAATSEGILISPAGRNRGVWTWRNGTFAYTPQGFTAPTVEVETVAEAVQHTVQVICGDS